MSRNTISIGSRDCTSRYGGGRSDARSLDFHQQILAADVGLQEDGLGGGAGSCAELRLDSGQVFWAPHVDLVNKGIHGETRPALKPVRFCDQRLDVAQRLTRLRGDVPRMQGAMSDDARGA